MSAAEQSMHPDGIIYSMFDEFDTIHSIAQGLEYMHASQIVHGDIKASNIFLSDSLQPLISDFGISTDQSMAASLAFNRIASRRWQAPELMLNGPQTSASDMFALGMTISEILTGQVPLSHIESDGALIVALLIQQQRPICEPLSLRGRDIRPLWKVACQCWDHEAEMRLSAGQLVVAAMRR